MGLEQVSLSRRNPRRDGNEPALVKLLEQLGASWRPLSAKGAPDGLVGWQFRTYLVEIKQPNGKLTADQKRWAEGWRGGAVHILRTAEDVYRLLHVKPQ